jgi:hypothetical protein
MLVALRACDELSFVMPGLVPGIHGLLDGRKKDVVGRDKPGHDGCGKK